MTDRLQQKAHAWVIAMAEIGERTYHVQGLKEYRIDAAEQAYLAGLTAGIAMTAERGDELNQCLQIIITNAGNIATSDTSVENHAAARMIESAVQRAAKAVRALAKGETQ